MPEANHWNNLLWAVTTEDISRDSSLPWLPRPRRDAINAYFSRADIRDRLAPALEASIRRCDEQQKNTRLGAYFENLWEFAFTRHPDYRLLHRNLPLRADGRTLGELDFVVQHLPSGATEHWEVAVKFYLQVEGNYWVGPGLRDRLDIKLARMRDHQLPVIGRPEAQSLLWQQAVPVDRQWCLVPGRLFTPLRPGAGRGGQYWWADRQTFSRHLEQLEESVEWLPLHKRCWLSEVCDRGETDEPCHQLTSAPLHNPLCVAGLRDGREISRGFIVPDDWAARAHGSLPG